MRKQNQNQNFRSRKSAEEWIQYRALYALCFSLFLCTTLMGRLSPFNWGAEGARDSVLGEARARTNATVPMVFSTY